MRLLVCGDRNGFDADTIKQELVGLKPDVVIHGAAKGVDSIAGCIAKEMKIPVIEFPANWVKYGRGAGPIRNKQMLDEGKPDMILAFHHDIRNSRGTLNMIKQAYKEGVIVKVIDMKREV